MARACASTISEFGVIRSTPDTSGRCYSAARRGRWGWPSRDCYPYCRNGRAERGNPAHSSPHDARHAFQGSQPWGTGRWQGELHRHTWTEVRTTPRERPARAGSTSAAGQGRVYPAGRGEIGAAGLEADSKADQPFDYGGSCLSWSAARDRQDLVAEALRADLLYAAFGRSYCSSGKEQ